MDLNLQIRLLISFFLLLASAHGFYAGDATQDQRALGELEKEIERAIAQKNAAPVQFVLKRYQARGAATFSGAQSGSDSWKIGNFLPKRRPLKISAEEWRALKKSEITIADSENGKAAFALLDLDEDGLRDLIVETYFGGTGLFTYVYVYRQTGGRFVSQSGRESSPPEEAADTALYSIGERGSDQEAEWVRVNNRVYLAYRNGTFGEDALVLLRAFAPVPANVKGLAVEYDYRHVLPRVQKFYQKTKGEKPVALNSDLYAALRKGLSRVEKEWTPDGAADFGNCPVPPNLSADEREKYASSWFNENHYTFETIADFPVFAGKSCYAARLISFKGNSSPLSGRYINSALWLLRSPESEKEEYEVLSTRTPRLVKIADFKYPFDEE